MHLGEELKIEAKKRGYKLGVTIVDLYPHNKQKCQISSDELDYELMPFQLVDTWCLRDSFGNVIYINGEWAKIIKP